MTEHDKGLVRAKKLCLALSKFSPLQNILSLKVLQEWRRIFFKNAYLSLKKILFTNFSDFLYI